jgi:hypothetical protein
MSSSSNRFSSPLPRRCLFWFFGQEYSFFCHTSIFLTVYNVQDSYISFSPPLPPLDTHSFSIVARDGSISYSCLISLLFFYFCTSTPAVGPSSAPKFFILSWLIFLVYTDRAGPIILTMVEGFHPQTGLTSISFTIRRRLWKLAGQGHLNRQTNQAYQTKSGQKKTNKQNQIHLKLDQSW